MYAIRESAISWCEGRYDPIPAPIRNLSWVRDGEFGGMSSTCGAFAILPTLDDHGKVMPDVFHALDLRLPVGHAERLSPSGSSEECKDWCESRVKLSVAKGADGNVDLIDNSTVPF